ncbi:NADPH-dependent FMN reductase [Haliangium ochraceum]|uniref:NADPH-dependent FMN reductase n=1 Tax=Haliangium ochraceum (strain DSM 14365 / JCM 11303 / SMP-2) TaxID=502025 RepID=D0LKE8_HALO1|nr:NAD(P)H-dependent oxidoreductase [Haliangium ochraceum]ACY14996.1 NADPH-dependent FMN reductase [Haliangium ochraceum DSM 14365]
MTTIRIVGLGGSANPRSPTKLALDAALQGAQEAGAEVRCFDVQTMDLPMYAYGMQHDAADEMVEAVRAAHGMIWCSPLYHGSVSGAFKNAVDWLEMLGRDTPPYLTGKVVGLVATAGGDQALQAINAMENIVRALRGWTLPLTAPVMRAGAAFDDDAVARDPVVGERLRTLGQELVRAASAWQP